MRLLLAAASTLSLAIAAPALAAEAPAAPADSAPVPQGQLTDAAAPKSYRLDLTVDPAKERFSGHVEIDAELKAAASFIDLHGRDLNVTRATATVGGKTVVGTWTQRTDSGLARLKFPEALPAGKVTLAFDYDAPFNTGPPACSASRWRTSGIRGRSSSRSTRAPPSPPSTNPASRRRSK